MTADPTIVLAALLLRHDRDHPVVAFTAEELEIASRRCLRVTYGNEGGLLYEVTPKGTGR